jgi:hypothetical protein
VSFSPQELAAAYALNVVPRLTIRPSTRLELYPSRTHQAFRVFAVRVEPPDPQLSLFQDGHEL